MSFRKGTICLISAWTFVPLTYGIIHIWLARYFGPEEYGTFGLVLSVLLWVEMLVSNGFPYAIQKFISSEESRANEILITAFRMQLCVAFCLFVISYLASPVLAKLFNDIRLTLYFRIAFLDILFIALFHLLASYQNGLRHFGKQASLYIIWGLSRLIFVFLLVNFTKSITGAFLANIAGALTGLGVAFLFLKKIKIQSSYSLKPLIQFALPSLFYFLMITLLLNIDLWIVKYFLGDREVGFYVAASMVAKVPYFISLGLAASVMPTVSNMLALKDENQVRHTIQQAFRLLLLISVPFAVFMTISHRKLMGLLFSSEYESGGPIVSILIWGFTLLSFLLILTTIINADHRPKASLCLVSITVFADVLLNLLLVPRYGGMGGALAATISIGLGFTITLIVVVFRFHVFTKLASLLRVVFSALLMGCGIWILLYFGLPLFWIISFGFLFYIVELLITREIQLEEIFSFLRESKT